MLALMVDGQSVYVQMFAGSGTPGFVDGLTTTALFNYPSALDVDSQDNMYVTDCNNNRLRKITAQGQVSTLAGSGAASSLNGFGTYATFNCPRGVSLDSNNIIWLSEGLGHRIRKITLAGDVTTYAGTAIRRVTASNFQENHTPSIQVRIPEMDMFHKIIRLPTL